MFEWALSECKLRGCAIVQFLASAAASSYVTGQVIEVNAGQVMP